MINKVLYILGQLSDEDADWLGSVGHRVRLNKGDILIQRGKQLSELYFVLDGKMQVLSPKQEEIAQIGIGDILGELSLLDENPTSADVAALTQVHILSVTHEMIFQRMSNNPEFSLRFYKALSMLLALRMRTTLSRFGAGDTPKTNITLLDQGLSGPRNGANKDDEQAEMAASRFERMVRRLWGIRQPVHQ